ncbi:hypothetical protein A2U01_0059412, partial [Trifolium medium]|nr:hypothetical protein [Trifolium medium]
TYPFLTVPAAHNHHQDKPNLTRRNHQILIPQNKIVSIRF